MNSLQAAIQFNNRGASLFLSGYTIEAMQLIQNAVRAIAKFNMDTSTSFEVILSTFALDNNNNNKSTHYAPPITHHLYCNDNMFAKHSDVMFVYGRPLIIPNHVKVSTCDDIVSLARMSGTYMVFNLAMVCHHYGLVSGNSAALKRAMELYLGVLSKHCHCSDMCRNFLNDGMNVELFQCLIVNNLAHLHLIFGEHDCSVWCMECIKDFVVRGRYLHTGFLTNHEAREIKLNLIFVGRLTTANAA